MKYRGRDEIIASILQSAATDNGMRRAGIMYNSFLSCPHLLNYLEHLMDNELLSYDQSKKVYKITMKGSEFLEIYNKMSDLLKITEPKVTLSISLD